MSISTRQQSFECAYCGSERDKHGVDGSYCSKLCSTKHDGAKLLNLLRHTHTHCANCGTQIKEVEEPTDAQLRKIDGFHSTTSLIGFQYQTEDGEMAQKEIGDGPDSRLVTGTCCSNCGNTATYTNFPELQERHLFEYANGILESLEDKQDEHNKDINRDTFFEMLIQTRDIEFSLGKAIQ